MKTEKTTVQPSGAAAATFAAAGEYLRRSRCVLPFVLLTVAAGQSATPAAPVAPAAPAVNAAVPQPTDADEADWRYAARLNLVALYDDNIYIRSTNKKDDFLLHAAPSFAVGIGNFRSEFAPFAPIPHFLARTGEEDLPHKNFAFGSYTPDAEIFATHHGQDAVNHDVLLEGRREREQWDVQGQFRFQSVEEPNIDVGRRTRQTFYTGGADADYGFSGRTTGSLAVRGEHAEYSGGLSSTDTNLTGFLDYQAAPKTNVALGATGGYLWVAKGANQRYVQPLLRLKYEATAKLSFSGQAGEEFRHYDSSIGNRTQFVFALNGNFAPADGTNLTLTGRRETSSSAEYAGENIVATTYQGSLRQRFLQRNYLALAGGFVRNDYENNQAISAVSRRDNYYFGKVSSSRDLTTRGTLELAYEHRTNDSSVANFGFNENVVSLAASFLY